MMRNYCIWPKKLLRLLFLLTGNLVSILKENKVNSLKAIYNRLRSFIGIE